MRKYFLILFGLLVITSLNAQQNYRLENKDLLAVFDANTGALTQFVSKKTKWKIIPQEQTGKSFDMFLNFMNGRNGHLDGQTQPKPEVQASGDAITFTWKSLMFENKSLGISFVGKIKLTNEGLEYGGEVINPTPYMVEQLSWPFIGEVSVPEGSNKLLFQYMSYTKFNTVELYPRVSSSYTGWCNLPEASFALIHDEKQGLYLSSKDEKLNELIRCMYEILPKEGYGVYAGGALSKVDNGERNQMRVQLKANRGIYTQPNMNTTLVPVVLKPYTGTWHAGVDIYKEWRKTWFVAPHRPEWVKRVNSWQQLQINGSEDNLNFTYKELVDYAKECQHYGVDAIQLTGWTTGGQDRGIPSHSTDPRLGTFDDLKNAIAESKKMGVNILLFTKFTWTDMTADLYQEYKKHVALDIHKDSCWHPGYNYYTYTQLLGINTRRFGVLCMVSDDCRKALRGEFQKCLDLGAQGMVYDENQHHAGHMFCFNPDHGHKIPGFLYQGADLLGHDFLEMTKKQDPDFLMNGEGPYDLQSKYYSTYTRADVNHFAVLRYIDPELPIACAVTSHNDRNTINMCLMDRYAISYEPRYFKGRLREFPRIMAYGQKIDQLREKYQDYLWYGEYCDVLGASVSGKEIHYSVFVRKSDGKKAVVVLNSNTNESSTATISIDGSKGSLLMVSPESPAPVVFNGTVKLEPQSVVVVMEK